MDSKNCRRKFTVSPSKSWILQAKFAEFRRKTVLGHSNSDLYHYAGNSPVKYTDPTGMWTITLGIGAGLAGKVKIGHNEGKWEFSWKVGFGAGASANIDFEDNSFLENVDSRYGVYIEGEASLDAGSYSLGVDSQIGVEGVISPDGNASIQVQDDASLSFGYGSDVTAGISVDNGELEIFPPSFNTEKSTSLGFDGMIFAGFGGSGVLGED